jgi:DNA-binding NarL/FixJ family response regulator
MILIVDDNKKFVDRMIGLLNELDNIGYINVANDYDEACRVLNYEDPDVVLLDINLPGKNGLELLKLIKKNTPVCEVIMITNHDDEYYRQQCKELGADHFLDKTIDFALVPDIVNKRIFGLS